MTDRYLDTADGALARAGWAARLRTDGSRVRVSLKARDGHVGAGHQAQATHRRAEVEGPADRDAPPAGWPPSPARDLLLSLAGGAPLGERFVAEQVRRERALSGPRGRALLTLDDVTFRRAGQTVGQTQVLEVELRGGGRQLLDELAAVLEADGTLVPEPRSKQQLAEDLIGGVTPPRAEPGSAPEPPSRRGPGVDRDDAVSEAGRKVLAFHLGRMLEREEEAAEGNIDAVHRMRVATRRMRAAWRVFSDAYRARDRKRHVDELRTIARRLGAARDLDVLLEDLDRYRDSADDAHRDALDPLRDAWSADRRRARASLRRLIGSKGYRRFVDDYRVFTRTPGAGVSADPNGIPRLVRDRVASAIWQAYERVRGYESVLGEADLAMLHALRIDGKRLRYTLEAYREVLGADVDGLIDKVTDLQDELGALHDADVAAGLAREFLATRSGKLPAEATEAIAGYLADREREIARRRRRLPRSWRPVAAASFRRSLGRALGAD